MLRSSPTQASWFWRGALLVLLLVSVILLYAAMFDHWHLIGDFTPHTVYMERMRASDPNVAMELPNTLYHGSVLIPASFFPQTTLTDWIMPVCVAWFLLLALLIWGQIRATLSAGEFDIKIPLTRRGETLAVVLTLTGLFIAPIFLFTLDNQYFGYMTPIVYHNPTMIPLRPIAFLLFIGAVSFASAEVRVWRSFERWQMLQVPLLASLTVASILAKPNFVMIFIPALVIWLVMLRLMRRHVDMMTVLMGIIIPGVVFLAYQSMTYSDSGIAFRPFYTQDVWALHYDSAANLNLALKILMSLAFPLVVTGLYLRRAAQSPMMLLAWIAAIGGVMLTYLFYDTGEPPAGNLIWSGQIGVMVLYLATLLFFVRQHRWLNAGRPRDLMRFGLCAAVLALHVVSGLIWYSEHLTGGWPQVIYTIW